MSKVLVVPDSRLDISRISQGIKLAGEHSVDYIVLLGNYFDPVDGETASIDDYRNMWEYLKKITSADTRIIPLIGERELSYINYDKKMPGYNHAFSRELGDKLINNYHFVPCIAIDGVLYSNAGVTTAWLRRYKIMVENDLRYRLGKRGGAGIIEASIYSQRTWDAFFDGRNKTASCCRASIDDLMYSAPRDVRQVVGLTRVQDITSLGRIWLTNSADRNQFLLMNDGDPEVILAE